MFKRTKSRSVSNQASFAELLRVIATVAPICHRPLADATGLYHNNSLFAVVYVGQLYLRTDAVTRRDFERFGLCDSLATVFPSCDLRDYYPVPGLVMENKARLQVWARNAMRIASLEMCQLHGKSA